LNSSDQISFLELVGFELAGDSCVTSASVVTGASGEEDFGRKVSPGNDSGARASVTGDTGGEGRGPSA
jgi:hypothetical protein